ncbi:MAG: uroporphyrinogen decarboxylase family protein [Gemmatimonadota bacterium]
MPTASMTHRERMAAVADHHRPDRIPAVLAARPEVDRALMAHYGVSSMAEVHRILGTEGWAGVGVGLDWGDWGERTTGRLEGDFPYAGRDYILHAEDTFEDEWGVVRRVGRDRKYVEWISGPLVGARDPEEYDFPGVERLVEDPHLARRVAELKAADCWVAAGVTMPYKTAWELRGMENLLADYLLDPGFVERLYDRIFGLYGEMLARCAAAGVDQVGFGGDIAMQDRIIMGPEAWRRIDKPRLAAAIARCRAIKPDVHVYIHSDGNLWAIMDDLIEIGFDIIDPIQPECMVPAQVKRRYGDRIVLHGCGGLQKTLPFGTVAKVRQEVIGLIEECGYDGGLVLRESNAIGFDCPVENVVAWFETARDYRWKE